MSKKITECCILKGNWGNWWQIGDVRIPRICLISKNKNTGSILFSLKQQRFLHFWKKYKIFMKIGWFCQKCKAMSFYIFYTKNKNSYLGIESVKKIWIFSRKSSKFMSFRVGNQCECFFHFFIFRKVIGNEIGFWKNFQQIHEKMC